MHKKCTRIRGSLTKFFFFHINQPNGIKVKTQKSKRKRQHQRSLPSGLEMKEALRGLYAGEEGAVAKGSVGVRATSTPPKETWCLGCGLSGDLRTVFVRG